MKTLHTPGPWKKSNKPYGLVNTVASQTITNESGQITIAYIDNSDTDEAVEANARLIAAAPEMFEALELVIKHFPKSVIEDQMNEDADKVFEAITKATEV